MTFGNETAQRRWMEDNRETVAGRVDGPLLAFGPGFRTNSYGAMAVSKAASPLAGIVMNLMGKKKAGGLPQNFIVAVTADKVQAFKYRPSSRTIKLGDPVAAWDRDT